METDRNYFVVGSFVLIVLACAVLFGIWMSGRQGESDYWLYRIRFAQSVSGLDIGSPVKFRGVNVGKVKDIMIDPYDTQLIRVGVEIVKTAPIKRDTVATLKLQGITGTVYIELTGSSPNAANLIEDNNNYDAAGNLPEIPAQPSSIDAILNQTPEILKKVSAIGNQMSKVLSDENVAAFNSMIQQMGKLASSLDAQTAELEQLLHHSDQTVNDLHGILQSSQEDFRKLTRNLEQSSVQLNQLVTLLNKNAGNQSQQFYEMVTQFKATSRDISNLTHQIEGDPSHIFLPTQQKGVPVP